jgi:hypothetical protein
VLNTTGVVLSTLLACFRGPLYSNLELYRKRPESSSVLSRDSVYEANHTVREQLPAS